MSRLSEFISNLSLSESNSPSLLWRGVFHFEGLFDPEIVDAYEIPQDPAELTVCKSCQ